MGAYTSPLTLSTMLTLLKRRTLLALTLSMNTLFYFDCLDHQELKNRAHYELLELYGVTRMGWKARTDGSYPLDCYDY